MRASIGLVATAVVATVLLSSGASFVQAASAPGPGGQVLASSAVKWP